MADEFPIVIELKETFVYDGETVKEIKINRKPRGGDLWNIPITDTIRFGDIMKIVQNITSKPPEFLKRISPEDTMKIAEKMSDFLPGNSSTGETA